MKKLFRQGYHDKGIAQMKARAFRPIESYDTIIEEINALYVADDYYPDQLLYYHGYGQEIVLVATTTLLDLHEDVEGKVSELEEEAKIRAWLQAEGLPEYLGQTLLYMNQEEPYEVIPSFIEYLMAPGQEIEVQITETAYWNSEFTLAT